MKELNYLPQEVKDRRLKLLTRRIGIVIGAVLVFLYVYVTMQISGLQETETKMQNDVKVVQSLESGIQEEARKLQELTLMSRSIINNPIPLNQFLGVILRQTPSDVVINDIFTGQSMTDSKRGARPEQNPVEDKNVDGVPEEEKPDEENPDAEKPEGEEVELPGIDDMMGQMGGAGTGTYTEPQVITIRGSAFNLQSISALANTLKNEEYIREVELSPIENYDDGYFNHKIFELNLLLGEVQ